MAVFRERVETAKSVFTLLRDTSIFGLIAAIIVVPGCVKGRLEDSGIKSIDAGVIQWKAQTEQASKDTKEAANQLTQLQNENLKLQDQLKELGALASASNNTQIQAEVESIQKGAVASAQVIENANTKIVKSLAVQDKALRQADSRVVAEAGWVYLGRITQDKASWAPGAGRTTNAAWPIPAGGSIEITDDVYVREVSATANHNEGRVKGAIKVGQTVQVMEVDTGRGWKPGGWTVWARVEIR